MTSLGIPLDSEAMSTPPSHPGIDRLPGHAIRRLHQISVGIFHQELQDLNLTPVQYGALQTVQHQPGIDQRTLARQIALDTSTTAGVVDRLEARGLLQRSLSPEDKRVRLLHLTDDGAQLLERMVPSVLRVQDRILEPLTPAEREEFVRLAQRVVAHHGASGGD